MMERLVQELIKGIAVMRSTSGFPPVTFIPRRDLAEEWKKENPLLDDRELTIETDTLKVKIGDGETPYNDLEYL